MSSIDPINELQIAGLGKWLDTKSKSKDIKVYIGLMDLGISQDDKRKTDIYEFVENSFKTIINVSLKGNKLCTIKTVFTIALGKNSDKIILKCFSKWEDKAVIIPDFVLEDITREIKGIVKELLN